MNIKKLRTLRTLVFFLFAITGGLASVGVAMAGAVQIVDAKAENQRGAWVFHVTLKHADTGWKHYADGWRIVDKDGKEFGYRKLWHPHVDEQPFTRSLANVLIPKDVSVVYVEAHDSMHGWNSVKVRIDFKKDKGSRYEIRRLK